MEKASTPKELAKLFKSVQAHSNRDLEILAGCDGPDATLRVLMDTHFPGSREGPVKRAGLEGQEGRGVVDPPQDLAQDIDGHFSVTSF